MFDRGNATASAKPGLVRIADVFCRYANFTLGGGSATIAVLHRELLDKRRWISPDDFNLCFALARLTPGTNLLAFCTGVGWLLQGMAGAVVALLAASIPCTAFVVIATSLFSHWQENPWAQAALHGAIAAAVAITVKTCWTIAHPHFKGRARLRVALVAAAAFLLYVWLALPAVEVLLFAGVVGALVPPAAMNVFLLYRLLLKATLTAFTGLASLPVVQDYLVIKRHVLTDTQLNEAVVITRSTPGPSAFTL